MIIVLGDLIADLSLHIPEFPIHASDIQRATFLEIGPGGAANIAITAARLGLSIGCLGEIGSDRFGRIVLEGLEQENIDISGVHISADAVTPVACVIVDALGEPAYLGYGGSLQMKQFPDAWRASLQKAEALYTGGWAEYEWTPKLILEGMRVAHESDVPVFFDPGPGNPAVDSGWWGEAINLTTVLLATENEARGLSGIEDPLSSARHLLTLGPIMAVIKRGAAGCFIVTKQKEHVAPGFPVQALDTTGAGDSLNAAVIYAYLKGMDLETMCILANAAGAAKVEKVGTGHNVPHVEEIRAILERFGMDPSIVPQ